MARFDRLAGNGVHHHYNYFDNGRINHVDDLQPGANDDDRFHCSRRTVDHNVIDTAGSNDNHPAVA